MNLDLPKSFRLVNQNVKRDMIAFSVNLPTDQDMPIKVTFEMEGKKRSLDQNAISHAWYEQLAKQLKEDNALGWKCYCKLHHGIPILRAEDEKFRDTYDEVIKPLAYEKKLEAMKILPVTSMMTTKQLSQYLEDVRNSMMAERGVLLEFPPEEGYEQLQRGK
jgi:Fe-S cluster assembly scaffold protein SufB